MSGIFISYRREDSAGYAGRVYDALTAEFGKRAVFIDVDSIRAGEDFVEAINKRIAVSSVVIVLIGKAWLNSRGPTGKRLDDPNDFVRLEVSSALRQKIPVVPVLVGGARMPGPGDLPGPLAPLAHLNAVEIFDQLFPDSVRHLIDELRPFVPSNSIFKGWTRRGLGGLVIFVAILLASLAFGVFVTRWKQSVASSPSQKVETQEIVPDPLATLDGLQESPPSRIKVTTSADISELPPVVETSKKVMLPGNSLQVTGPSKPRILWRASVTIGDEWSVVGIASDGTVYVYDSESNVLDGIRDGKELWAHDAPSPLGFDAEGRIWMEDSGSYSKYSFNSRGEGGRVTKKGLWPDSVKLQRIASSRRSEYFCREGKVSRYAQSKRPWIVTLAWSVDLDGNCSSHDPVTAVQTGNIYVSSDAGTLYAISPDGHVLWTVKQACKDVSYNVYPVLNDDLVVACDKQALYSLHAGKPLWATTLGPSEERGWGDVLFDASGNIYVGTEGPPRTGYMNTHDLVAFNKAGKQEWAVSTGEFETPQPVAFDIHGTLYVTVGRQRVVALSQ